MSMYAFLGCNRVFEMILTMDKLKKAEFWLYDSFVIAGINIVFC